MTKAVRLNLGAGGAILPGYTNLDRKTGEECYPLAYGDATVDEIRASHLLEHFPHAMVGQVIADWVRALKPGGVLKVAVPDFAVIARAYLAGKAFPVQGVVMGGQVDRNDYHHAIFDADCLADALRAAGLIAVSRWTSEADDCAALPVSLNLMGIKPGAERFGLGRVLACMSVPRLGFMDNFFSATQALLPLGIGLRKATGAFWGQCLERCFDEAIEAGADWILAIDYDTVFTREHVETLLSLAARHPEADAIAPVQAARTWQAPLMTIKGEDGRNLSQVPLETFDGELARVSTAHFGLTLIRVSALQSLPRPWFKGEPGKDGRWDLETGRIDDDIWFWRQLEKAGKNLYLANRVAVGHLELMIRWPDREFKCIYQHPNEFWKEGAPEDTWK